MRDLISTETNFEVAAKTMFVRSSSRFFIFCICAVLRLSYSYEANHDLWIFKLVGLIEKAKKRFSFLTLCLLIVVFQLAKHHEFGYIALTVPNPKIGKEQKIAEAANIPNTSSKAFSWEINRSKFSRK